jgi:hypothetical protein
MRLPGGDNNIRDGRIKGAIAGTAIDLINVRREVFIVLILPELWFR